MTASRSPGAFAALALVLAFATHPAGAVQVAPAIDEAAPLDVSDCQSACRECQRPCKTIACEKACTANLVGCCVGYGKKPPAQTSCWCG
jgi:hypothetical protein